MTQIFLHIFDFFQKRRRLCFGLLFALLVLFTGLTATLNYKEDIYDFLPFDDNHRKELAAYQKISQADRIVVIFQMKEETASDADNSFDSDADKLSEAVDLFGKKAETINRWSSESNQACLNCRVATEEDEVNRQWLKSKGHEPFKDLTTTIDYEQIFKKRDYIFQNIPYFLTQKDYDRIDSLLTPDYVKAQIEQDKTMLMFPTGSILSDNIQRDPLNLFSPTVSRLQTANPALQFELSDGHVFSEDMTKAYSFFTTPYGASETSHNKELSELLDNVIAEVEADIPEVKIHSTGAPIIAVGNATQIKTDSILALAIAITLILALLLYSFRSLKNLLYISISIFVGWLFAMACLSIIHDSVSIIVLGIASVVIGISVNYPLHLVAHLKHQPDIRQAIKEIVVPLVIGNITTVGAFLCLVPLDSVAMRDLGLFGSFMLIGTILFVILFLPHILKGKVQTAVVSDVFERVANMSLESKWIVVPVILLTGVFGYHSLNVSFDADISHINFMTDEQRADLNEVQGKMASETDLPIYILSEAQSWDAAVERSEKAQATLDSVQEKCGLSPANKRSATDFIPSKAEQKCRLERWHKLLEDKGLLLTDYFDKQLAAAGFDIESFREYHDILAAEYKGLPEADLQQLAKQLFPMNVCHDSLTTTVVDVLSVPARKKDDIIAELNELLPDNHAFDIQGMNSAMANSLSDDFNYIGFSCAFIVFFFLWLSFGSIELAIIAFLPMAVSWIWILGIMQMCGMQFNIVNVILATFIFGQGDDYTIFMTEGLIYEHAYKRRMLASYKNSIILSALIMFIGIGSLIVAKHPALRSLAEVTIVGMASVVLMAYLLPSLVFKWMVQKPDGSPRKRPLTLSGLITMAYYKTMFFLWIAVLLLAKLFLYACSPRIIHKVAWRTLRPLLNMIPRVHYRQINPQGWDFSRPHLIVCNHQSWIDSLYLLAMSPKVVLLPNSQGSVLSKILYQLHLQTSKSADRVTLNNLKDLVKQGYSIAAFLQEKCNDNSSTLQFQQETFLLAKELNLDILPVYIHGADLIFQQNNFCIYDGTIHIIIGKAIKSAHFTSQPMEQREQSSLLELPSRDRGRRSQPMEQREQSSLLELPSRDRGRRSQLTDEVYMHYLQNYKTIKSTYETLDFYKSFVIDRYRYKGAEIMRSVKHSLKNIDNQKVSLIENARQTQKEIHLTDTSYGEIPLLIALTLPNHKIIVSIQDEDKRQIAINSSWNINNLLFNEK